MAHHGLLTENPAEYEGERRRAHGDGAGGVEAAGGGVEAAAERVDVDDVGQEVGSVRIRELAPRRSRHTVPGVPVDVLVLVCADHRVDRRTAAEAGLGFSGGGGGCSGRKRALV